MPRTSKFDRPVKWREMYNTVNQTHRALASTARYCPHQALILAPYLSRELTMRSSISSIMKMPWPRMLAIIAQVNDTPGGFERWLALTAIISRFSGGGTREIEVDRRLINISAMFTHFARPFNHFPRHRRAHRLINT